MMRTYIQTSIISVMFCLPLLVYSKCVLEPDEENVVSTQLEGSWVANMELNEILGNNYIIEAKETKFYKNDSIVDLIPKETCMLLTKLNSKIYMTGEVTFIYEDEPTILVEPFILTSISGNPAIVLLEDGEAVFGFYLMMVRAVDSDKDVMFADVDVINQEFYAFK